MMREKVPFPWINRYLLNEMGFPVLPDDSLVLVPEILIFSLLVFEKTI